MAATGERRQVANWPGTPGGRGEDRVCTTTGATVVLDGVSAPAGTGCAHSTAWFVDTLGATLLDELDVGDERSLRDCLARAISVTRAQHRECVLEQGGPAAAVAIVRERDTPAGVVLDVLVLADVTVAWRPVGSGTVQLLTDRRVDAAQDPELRRAALRERIGSEAHRAAVARMSTDQLTRRNRPGGYWVAAGDPGVAEWAWTRELDGESVAQYMLLTDGASALVDSYRLWSWGQVFDLLASDGGPAGLLEQTRRVEGDDPTGRWWPRFKTSDDAAVAWVQMRHDGGTSSSREVPNMGSARWSAHASEISEGVSVVSGGVPRLVVGVDRVGRGQVELTFVDGTTRVCWPHETVSVVVDEAHDTTPA